jgi:hypothetical protein
MEAQRNRFLISAVPDRINLLAIFLSLAGLSIIVRSLLPTDKVDRKQNG